MFNSCLSYSRFAAVLCGVTLVAQSAPAQVADPVKEQLDKSPRHHEWVDVESQDGRKVKCFVVFPEVEEKATAVIVIHENKGLTDWVRKVADSVAEKGYVAIAPDFLSGAGPDGGNTDSFASIDAATQGIYKLQDAQVMADLDATASYVTKLDASNGKLACMGFCWGGGKSFAYAAHNPKLGAALVFYGSAPDDATLEKVTAPVYGFYGGNDRRITGQVPSVTEKMKKIGKKYEPVVYEGAGHGFMRTAIGADASDADRKAHEAAKDRVKKILGGL
ncbi:MAG: dienelactone hydrolase family protein [Pirellulales bacterium]|nr:dienelactone hydrolase family protein [Pirellulales bacterium]